MDLDDFEILDHEGNIETILLGTFQNCPKLKNIEYYGTTSPTCENSIFSNNHKDLTIKVTSKYESETFCDKTVEKSLQ